MCQCKLMNCNKYNTLVRDIDNEGGYACVGSGDIWELSVSPYQFFYESKSALKTCFLKFDSNQDV